MFGWMTSSSISKILSYFISIKSSQKQLRNSIKQSNLDHLQHNQENDLDPLKTHISLGQHTNTKNADLDLLKNTQHVSANTQNSLV